MTRPLIALGLFLLAAACGADGAPTAPATSGTQTGIVVTGDAQMGMTNQ